MLNHKLVSFLLLFAAILCLSVGSIAQTNAQREKEVPMRYEDTKKLFDNPGNAWRGKPFWSWNGKLDKDELLRQIGVVKNMGFGGFFMHSRTGLATEYLGEDWFNLINTCADEAEKLGMEAWLYDEDRWPSGSAGGKATEDPQYRMKYLLMDIKEGATFQWDVDLVAAFACKLDGINYTDAVQLSADSKPEVFKEKSILTFRVVPMDASSFYNGNTYLDTLSLKATEHFINLTHEQYKAHCGDRLGRSIQGIFTDEPHHGMVMCKNVSQGSLTRSEFCTPWTESLPATFAQRFGYDLIPRLPELFLRPNGQRISLVKWQYMENLQQMFLDNWAKPIQNWCSQNGLKITGHVLHEDSLGAQAVPCGSMMRYYEYMDNPGVDVLSEGNRNYWIVKQLSSAARQLGKPWLLSELYGCTGWQMNFASYKAAGDWQSLFGINVRCPHLSWYTMDGESKRDFPASIFYQSTWYPDFAAVETYFSRMQAVMSQGSPDCSILVINPIESTWAQIYAGWATWLSSISPEVQALDRQYQELFHWLCGAQLDFDLGDEDMLNRLGQVGVENGAPALRLGNAQYRVAVVSGLETIRPSTLDRLEEFQKAGGMVIMAGTPPAYVGAVASDRPAQLAKLARCVPFERDAVVNACAQAAGHPVTVSLAGENQPAKDIFCQTRIDGPLRYVLALNMDRKTAFPNCKIRIQGTGVVEEWDPLHGDRFSIPAKSDNGFLEFSADFPVAGEKLYVIAPASDTTPPAKPVLREIRRQAIPGPYAYKLDEPNLCVLDRAACRVDDGEWQEAREILKVDRALRDAFKIPRRGGEMVQPWFSGHTPKQARAKVALRFDFDVETVPESLDLLIEHPELFSIAINGNVVAPEVKGWMLDTCFKRVNLPVKALHTGSNQIEISVGFHEDINLESLYLAGNFGVRIDGVRRILIPLPEKLEASDTALQGLPFYSGRIRYHLPIPADAPAGARAFLDTEQFEGACVNVLDAAGGKRLIAWAPYEAEVTDLLPGQQGLDTEVVLTRRNTFGPLHAIPLRAGGYGPDNWVTEGKAFTDDYMLYPAGLLAPPSLVWRTP